MATSLPPEKMRAALDRINTWRAHPDEPVACPLCMASGLKISDHSARPYAEWYKLACPACGLEQTIHIPIAPNPS